MNVDRLQHLSGLLRKDAADPTGVKFDLSSWASTREHNETPKMSCGTAACAIGVACLSKEFEDEGFSYEISSYRYPEINITPKFKHSIGWFAVRNFFELDRFECAWLFYDSNYTITTGAEAELEVANRIDQLIANDGLTDKEKDKVFTY